MIDPHRRCGSTGRAASISTFEGSNSSSSCGSRLGNREVEHGENDGVDEWHVAGDHGGATRAGSAGGQSPGGSRGRERGRPFGFLGETAPGTGLPGKTGPATAGPRVDSSTPPATSG